MNLTKTENQFTHPIFGELTTIINTDNEIFFISNQVSSILDYSKNANMLEKIDSEDILRLSYTDAKSVLNSNDIHSSGTQLITEKGLYSAISRNKKLSSKQKENFIDWCKSFELGLFSKVSFYTPRETEFIHQLKQALNPFGLEVKTQFSCAGYLIDAYIGSLGIAIEFDENSHNHYDKEKESKRETAIMNELNCEIIRVSDKDTDSYNIGLVIKQIFNIK